MTTFPTSFSPNETVITDTDLSADGASALSDLREKGYRVQLGITKKDAEALTTIVTQPSIQQYCPGDCTERFKDVAMTEHWLQKGRLVFLLKSSENKIAGYGWTGPSTSEHVPDATLTGGIRISELHQGRKLAAPYLAVILDYTKQFAPGEVMWFGTWGSNAGAVHTYEKLGFETVAREPAERVTPSGERTNDTRLFMRL